MQSTKARIHTIVSMLMAVSILFFTLVACTSNTTNVQTTNATAIAAKASSPTTSATLISSSTGTPQVQLGVQSCPTAISQLSYWDAIVPTQPNVSHVESVTCATLMGIPRLQALVTVRYQGTASTLDLHVYDQITSTVPMQIFKLQGLYKGSAKISAYNTVLTAEVDPNSSINTGKANAALTQDLFREFKWSDGAGTLVPITFPGIYPDLTRYQAENDQQQVNQGTDPWKLSATLVAQALATNLLQWPSSVTTTLVSGGGKQDVDAQVDVQSPSAGAGVIHVAMSRLENNANGGIWIVTAVTSDSLKISTPPAIDILSSPITVTGQGNATGGKIGTLVVLDHLYTNIGHSDVAGSTSNGTSAFSTTISYTSSFKGGDQEGILALYAYNNADGSIATATLQKELLG